MNLTKLKEDTVKFLENEGLKLYDLTYDTKEETLTVMLDESMDLDKLEEVSNKISDFMDGHDEELGKYILDVTTVGAERPIRNEEEVKAAVGSYVFVKEKKESYNGTLKKYEDGKIYLEYLDKTKKKEAVIDYKEVKVMRYAIKF